MNKTNRKINLFFGFFALCLLASLSAQAQLEMVPLPQNHAVAKKKTGESALRQMAESDTIQSLPFWDDFSFSGGVPDDSLWVNSEHVRITRNIAIMPPSVGVATFDGTDTNGQPHSQDADQSDRKDLLTSKPINLGPGVVTVEEQNSLFLSFYWQLQGRGNIPEGGDSLRLFFLDSDSIAHQVWPSATHKVEAGTDPTKFYRVAINLKEEGERLNVNFFHDGFRFRFVSTNRLSGMYDLWHLDYVQLGKAENNSSLYAEDRALSEIKPSLFKIYTALPIEHFYAAPEKYIDIFYDITAFNLQDPAKDPNEIDYFLNLFANQQQVYEKEKKGTFLTEQVGQTYYHTTDTIKTLTDIFQSLKGNDSLYITTMVRVEDENILENPFYALNNTDTIQNVLHDYFAYDDGTSEMGIAFRGGNGVRMAVEYTLEVQDTLTHIDLYLPFYGQSIGGQYAKLGVWKSLAIEDGTGEEVLLKSQSIALRNSSTLNTFDSYPLQNPLVLPPGTYYFGLEKETDRIVTFGFDRNTSSQEKVFFSTDQESWSQELEENGSLMLRPRFSRGVDPLTLGIGKNYEEPETSFPARIYPNPNDGFFVVESEAQSIQVFSMQGQLIRTLEQPRGTYRQEIDLRGLQRGLYLVKLTYKDGIITKKILIKN